MADITLHRDDSVNRTIVPNSFIDAYMIRADGEFVKVYLYLLRCMGDPMMTFSTNECADKFEHTEKDIIRALKYWESAHLIRMDYDSEGEICSIYLTDTSNSFDVRPVMEHQIIADVERAVTKPSTHVCRDSERFSQVTFIAECYLGRTLGSTEVDTLVFWVDTLGFDNDLIDYLIDSCVAGGHKSFQYMDKVALSWAKKGITTVDEARAENRRHSELYTQIMRSFGISGRSITTSEEEFITSWTSQYGFGVDIITEACDRTIRSIHQPDFRYADSILRKWRDSGVKTVADIQKLDEVHSKCHNNITTRPQASSARPNFTSRDYDRAKLERELLHNATD